uniref:Uncharacterized protein n=1 Tax=Bos indicus x Bos taurus TaxID=30522 RepID=A0A4W2DZJ5_BOBOX
SWIPKGRPWSRCGCYWVSPPVFISLLLLSCPSFKSQACQQLLWPLPSPLVAFRAKGKILVTDFFSTSQYAGREHTPNLCNTSSPPTRPSLL